MVNKMRTGTLIVFAAYCLAVTIAQGSNCGASDYLVNAAFTVNPTPAKGKTSLLTLTGVTPNAMTLQEWDIFVNLNGVLTSQFDVPITGTYAANSQIVVKYNFTTSLSTEGGYYSMRLLLQNTEQYYVNCWIYNYYISG